MSNTDTHIAQRSCVVHQRLCRSICHPLDNTLSFSDRAVIDDPVIADWTDGPEPTVFQRVLLGWGVHCPASVSFYQSRKSRCR